MQELAVGCRAGVTEVVIMARGYRVGVPATSPTPMKVSDTNTTAKVI